MYEVNQEIKKSRNQIYAAWNWPTIHPDKMSETK
jgi:hypothetical protein